MEVLITFLIIIQLIVWYYLRKYIKAYKENNQNFITAELRQIQGSFQESIAHTNKNVKEFSLNVSTIFEALHQETTVFKNKHKKSFSDLSNFIKRDYKSLTEEVKQTNTILVDILNRTNENISKNEELIPVLINSSVALDKAYGKIKLIASGYEKSLKDIKSEMENTVITLENTVTSRIKQLATHGEKTLVDTAKMSTDTITHFTAETNSKLKLILKEDQLITLNNSVAQIGEELAARLTQMNQTIEKMDTDITQKLDDLEDDDKEKKKFFGF